MAELDLNEVPKSWLPYAVMALPLLVLLGLVLGFSIHNSERLALTVENGQVFVEKGIFFPWGSSTYTPHAAFEAVTIPDELELELPTGECEQLVDCERRFYHAILAIAAALLERRAPKDLERLRELLVRAQLFPSIGLGERAPIEDLTGAIHYIEALMLLDEVQVQLELSRKKLLRSRISGVAGIDTLTLDALIDMIEKQLTAIQSIRPSLTPLSPAPTTPNDAAEPVEPLDPI
ncbi:MAG: hypothetical protein RBU37_04750 [Myxococcota bacterium]|jgi:hypothetical protein|nr:hypothetical protein [Myxococcota bacterium]